MNTPSVAVGHEPAYEPKLIYYSDRDEFEFVTKDVATIYRDLLPTDGAAIIFDMATRDPIGFRIAGSMVRAASSRRPLNAVSEYGEPVAWTYDLDIAYLQGECTAGRSTTARVYNRMPSIPAGDMSPLYSAATVSALVAERDEAKRQAKLFSDMWNAACDISNERGIALHESGISRAAAEARNAELVEDARKLAARFEHTVDAEDAKTGRLTWPFWLRGHPSATYHGGSNGQVYSVTFVDFAGRVMRAFEGDTIELVGDGDLQIRASAALQSQEPRNG